MLHHVNALIQQIIGFGFSFLIYYGLPFHHKALTRIYTPFVKPGDLCFDIGAHLGDRVRAFSKLGARVVALEPQPALMNWLKYWYGNRRNIILLEKAVSSQTGMETMWVSRLNPSMSTISKNWLNEIQKKDRFSKVHWEEQISVTVTTLDNLIAEYGIPAFCKIDVEGAELDVLQGLTQAIPALSFEYIPAMPEPAIGCIERLGQLGKYEYNWRVSEWPKLRSPIWLKSEDMIAILKQMSDQSDSGDIYARLVE